MNSIGAAFQPHASGGTGPKQGSIPSLKLNDGNEIPLIAFGLGTALYIPRADSAIWTGLNVSCVLCFITYGNEKELGIAIKKSGVPRSELFVTTKVWAAPKSVKASFDASLKRLGLDYVDLYLLHWPQIARSPQQLQEFWAEMEAIKESGRAKSIGVSNFLQEHFETILETAKVTPAINQIEFHPYLQRGTLLDFHRQHGIATAAYGPLTPITKASPGPVDDIYVALGRKYGVTDSDIGLRWIIDQGIVAVTTSSNEQRVQGFLKKIPGFKLTPSEVKEISELGKQKHFRAFFNDIYGADDRR